jgi:hypothetical protein
LRQICDFLRFSPPIKLLKVALNTINQTNNQTSIRIKYTSIISNSYETYQYSWACR